MKKLKPTIVFMKKIFEERIQVAEFRLKFGAESPVGVRTVTRAWFAPKRQVLVIEHTTEIEGSGHRFLDSKLRDQMAKAPELVEASVTPIAIFFVKYLHNLSTEAEAIRSAVSSADAYGIKMADLASDAWAVVRTKEEELYGITKRRHEEQEQVYKREEEARIAEGYTIHTSWPCTRCGAMDEFGSKWCPPPEKKSNEREP